MTSHFSALSEAEQERLAVLIEECGEVVQIACKILRHGYRSHHPDRALYNNRQLLEHELGHVVHAIGMMEASGDVNDAAIGNSAHVKSERIKAYLHHQKGDDHAATRE